MDKQSHKYTEDAQPCHNFIPFSEERIATALTEAPINQFVGNTMAVKRLLRTIHIALGTDDHDCGEHNFAFFGPPSTGKTMLARLFAESVELPFIEINGPSVKSVEDIFFKIAQVLDNTKLHVKAGFLPNENLSLVPGVRIRPTPHPERFLFPPCIVFIDEVHALKPAISEALLKATEKNDRWLHCEKFVVDCTFVCWIIATTDSGDLGEAFHSRFEKIKLDLYSRDEIEKIIKMNYPDFNEEDCETISIYGGHVPREALAFAKQVQEEMKVSGENDVDRVAEIVAEQNGIDQFGMSRERLLILKALGQRGPMSKARIASMLQVQEAELMKYIVPPLLMSAHSFPLIETSSRGFCITNEGIDALDDRGIKHLDEKDLALTSQRFD